MLGAQWRQGERRVGLFDSLSGVLQGQSGGAAASAAGTILESLQQSGGMGNLVQSWIGTGQNLPVSPQQIGAALGPEWINKLAQRAGLPPSELLQHLSTVLPPLIDHLTPQGQMPQGNLSGVLGALIQQLGRR